MPDWLAQSVGKTIPVRDGPFTGMEGVLNKIDKSGLHAEMLLGLFDSIVVTSLPIEALVEESEKPRSRRSRSLHAHERGLLAVERDLAALVADGLYRFDPGPLPVGSHDLLVRENWVWLRATVRPRLLGQMTSARARQVCGLWFVRLPVLFTTRSVIARASVARGDDAAYEPDEIAEAALGGRKLKKRREYVERMFAAGAVYRAREYEPKDFLKAAEKPLDDELLHKFRRRQLDPLWIVFQPLPTFGEQQTPDGGKLSCFHAVPLLPWDVLAHGVVKPWGWGVVEKPEDVGSALRRSIRRHRELARR